MMAHHHRDANVSSVLRHTILTLLAVGYVLFADYGPLVLAGLVCLFFVVYIAVRLIFWFNNDRFTPDRLRVGVTWALVGIDEEAEEFDSGPALTYFSLLLLLFAGLLLRPILGFLL